MNNQVSDTGSDFSLLHHTTFSHIKSLEAAHVLINKHKHQDETIILFYLISF